MTDQQPPELPQKQPSTAIPRSPQTKPAGPDPDYIAMEGSGFSQILSHLLRKPMSIVYSFNHEGKSPASALLLITLVCLAIFGFVIGIFSAGDQLWAAPLKVIGGVLFSALFVCLACISLAPSVAWMPRFSMLLG